MNAITLNRWLPWRGFNRAARLFLLAILVDGVIYSAWQLFFNLYILARGYPREFLGFVNAVPSVATLLLGIPIGMLSDRIGRRRAMLLGVLVYSLGGGLQLLVSNQYTLLAWGLLAGVGYTLWYVSQAPFMMAVAEGEQRTLLFSLSFGMVTMASAVGSIFAGQLPALAGGWLGVAPDSPTAYRAVLMLAVILGTGAMIPLFLLKENIVPAHAGRSAPAWGLLRRAITWKLNLPNILIGTGAGLIVPYLNVFFVERFNMPDATLGVLFALSALLTGVGSIWAPRLARQLRGKIRTVVFTQAASLGFILLLGFTPWVALASAGFLLRNMFMNMSTPLMTAFSMEQYSAEEQGMANGLMNITWTGFWSVSMILSGYVQARYGFTPLFIVMAVLYALSTVLTWLYFADMEREQQRAGQATATA